MARRAMWVLMAAVLAAAGLPAAEQAGAQAATAAEKAGIPSDKVPAYDVVVIRPDKTGSGNVSIRIDDGNYDATNVSVKNLILNAYGLKEAQLEGLPGWGETARFDIKAKILEPDLKVLGKLTPAQWRSMLQPMLLDRFGLKSHREEKTLPVYELVVAKGGPKFGPAAAPDRGDSLNTHNRSLSATSVQMSEVADWLSGQMQRVVIDRTGLAGKYDLKLRWSPDDGPPPEADAPPPLLTALDEQLGLKLVASHAPVEMFVVDHVELPSEN